MARCFAPAYENARGGQGDSGERGGFGNRGGGVIGHAVGAGGGEAGDGVAGGIENAGDAAPVGAVEKVDVGGATGTSANGIGEAVAAELQKDGLTGGPRDGHLNQLGAAGAPM